MPNWCNCDLNLIGKESDIAKFANDFYDLKEKSFSMEKLLPMPDNLKEEHALMNIFNVKEEYDKKSYLFDNVVKVSDISNVERHKDFVVVGTLKKKDKDNVTIDSWGEELEFQIDCNTKKEIYFINNCFLMVVFNFDGVVLKCKAIIGSSFMIPNVYVPIKIGTYNYQNDVYDDTDVEYKLKKEIQKEINFIDGILLDTKYHNFKNYIPLLLDNETKLIPYDIAILAKIAANANFIRGYNCWYDWNIENFGTKWDISSYIDVDDFIKDKGMSYETAWGPNEAFYFNISKDYPELTFKLSYDEEGVGFAGECEIKNGVYLSNEYYDVSKDAIEYYKKLIDINGYEFIENLLFEYDFDEDFIVKLCDACDVPEELKNEAIKNCRDNASGE